MSYRRFVRRDVAVIPLIVKRSKSIVLTAIVLIIYSNAQGENIRLLPDSSGNFTSSSLTPVGRITSIENIRLGTGFVAGKNRNVFTVAHVALKDTLLFLPFGSNFTFKITLKYQLASLDLAIYERSGGEHKVAYDLGEFDRVHPGDSIFYLGWKSDNILEVGVTSIMSKGKLLQRNELIDYIEFVAQGIPGFSGGPVFNDQGQVIAIISQGWDYKPINAEKPLPILRAFSVDLLRFVENDLKTSAGSDRKTSGDLGIINSQK